MIKFLKILAAILNSFPKTEWKPIHLCWLYNKHGVPIPNLVGKVKAPTVTTQAVSSIAATTATGNGTVTSNGGETTTRGICYVSGSGGTPTTSDSLGATAVPSTGEVAFTSALTGLTASTTYSVRAYATNSIGTSYGAVVEFTTTNTPPTVVLNTPTDTATGQSVTPTLEFTGTDAESEDIDYNVQIDTVNTFDSQVDHFDSYAESNGNAGYTMSSTITTAFGQSFTASVTGVLTDAKINLYRDGAATGTCYCAIYSHSGTYGTSSLPDTLLATSDTQNAADIQTTQGVFVNFTFSGSDRIVLTSATNYVLTFHYSDGSIGETLGVYRDTTSPTHSGNFSNFDGSWNVRASEDLPFSILSLISTALINKVSETDTGFANVDTPADTHPFNSGDKADYDVQVADTLDASTTYYWRARAIDPTGSDTYGAWATTRSFTTEVANTSPTTVLGNPADTATGVSQTPQLYFTGSDVDGDDVEYNVQVDTSNTFAAALIDSYDENNAGVDSDLYDVGGLSSDAYSQSFTGDGRSITSADLYLKKTGSPTGNAVAKIYAITGTYGIDAEPTGSALATSDTFDVSTLGTSYALENFVFSTPYKTTNGTYYCLVLSHATEDPITSWTATNKVSWGGDNSTPTHDGNGRAYRNPSWVSWGIDFGFYVYGTNLLDKFSATPDAGFTAGHPFTEDVEKSFTVQSGDTLDAATEYFWRVAATDPLGTDTYGAWATTKSFTTETGSTTTTKTTTGVARIEKEVTKTITGVSNIETASATTKTITGKSNIKATTTKTIGGTATISSGIGEMAFLQATESIADTTAYTFADENLGTVDGARSIIVAIASRKGGTTTTLNSVTVGGVTATITVQRDHSATNSNISAIAVAEVPTGTTGDIVVTFDSTMARCAIGVYRATSLESLTAHDSGSSVVQDPTYDIDVPAGGFSVGVVSSSGNTSVTWTGLTEDYDGEVETYMTYSGASDTFASAQTNLTVTGNVAASTTEHSGCFASWGFSGDTTVDQTQTGVARIEKTVTKTTTGTSRVGLVTTKTQDGLSRIEKTVDQTQTGVAKLLVDEQTSQTQTGKANIKATTTKIQYGNSRIETTEDKTTTGQSAILVTETTTKNINGTSRIEATTTKAQDGTARIGLVTTKIQDGLARIETTEDKTISGVANLLVTEQGSQTQTGVARIEATTTKTQFGTGRIETTEDKTIDGTSAILVTETRTKTRDGVARVEKTVTETIDGTSRIEKTRTQTQDGVARIGYVTTKTRDGLARVTTTEDKTTSGVAKIVVTGSASQSIDGVANIKATTTQTQFGNSRIETTVSKTIDGGSRITKSATEDTTGKSRIEITTTQTQDGVGRIETTETKTTTGTARVGLVTTKTQDGLARIETTESKTITGVAKIVVTGSSSQSIQGTSTIEATTDRTQFGTSRIGLVTSKTQDGVARIETTSSEAQDGVARIETTVNQTQDGVARVTTTTNEDITGKSRIGYVTTETQDGVARVTTTEDKTISGVSKIVVTGTTTESITGTSNIKATTDQTQFGGARIKTTVSETIDGVARITTTTDETQDGVARIKTTSTEDQTGLARIKTTVDKTISGVAKILVDVTTTQTQDGVANIKATTTKTIDGVANIKATTTKTIDGVAKITGGYVDRTITGTASIIKRYHVTDDPKHIQTTFTNLHTI